jgi:hypothetical protein
MSLQPGAASKGLGGRRKRGQNSPPDSSRRQLEWRMTDGLNQRAPFLRAKKLLVFSISLPVVSEND